MSLLTCSSVAPCLRENQLLQFIGHSYSRRHPDTERFSEASVDGSDDSILHQRLAEI